MSSSRKEYISIIEPIVTKEDWTTKIHDAKIVKKWKQEIKEQEGNTQAFDSIISALRSISSTFMKDVETLGDYSSFIQYTECDLEMVDKEYATYLDNLQGNGSEAKEYMYTISVTNASSRTLTSKSFSPGKAIEVVIRDKETGECTILFSSEHKQVNYVRPNEAKHIPFSTFIITKDKCVPTAVKKAYKQFLTTQKATDIQPWTKQKVHNYFHPSMSAYIKGKSILNDGVSPSNHTFQWLATNTHIDYSQTGEPTVSFLSPVHFYDIGREWDIPVSSVLKHMIPMFNECIRVCGERLMNISSDKLVLQDCQFIIKAQELKLGKDDTWHSEGGLHLEGTSAEKIIATGIYYPQISKSLESHGLRFYTNLREPNESDYYLYAEEIYERTHDRHSSRHNADITLDKFHHLRTVYTEEDLGIVFPNNMYHSVSSIQKRSGSIGNRHILVFWLVHPDHRIISTSDILSLGVNDIEAGIYRECLMYERKHWNDEFINEDSLHFEGLSLCEH